MVALTHQQEKKSIGSAVQMDFSRKNEVRKRYFF